MNALSVISEIVRDALLMGAMGLLLATAIFLIAHPESFMHPVSTVRSLADKLRDRKKEVAIFVAVSIVTLLLTVYGFMLNPPM
jgi:hypothetical protein